MAPHCNSDLLLPRYQALLAMADLLSLTENLEEAFRDIPERLKTVVPFDFLNMVLRDPLRDVMHLNLWQGIPGPSMPLEFPASESVAGWVWDHQEPLVLPVVTSEPRFPKIMEILGTRGIRSYCMLPLTSGQSRFGALGFGTSQPFAYDQRPDLEFLQRVAKLIALVLQNTDTRLALTRETERLQALLAVNNALAASLELGQLVSGLSSSISRVLPHEYLSIAVDEDSGTQGLRLYEYHPRISPQLPHHDLVFRHEEVPGGSALRQGDASYFTRAELQAMSSSLADKLVEKGIQTLCCVPLSKGQRSLGGVSVGCTEERTFTTAEKEILSQLAAQMAVALESARAHRQIAELKDNLAEEKSYLEGEIRTELNFEHIIGESTALKETLAAAKTVAPSSASVMILGETGTGKELVARAIHQMSLRKEKSFIKVNCAAIPTGLLESELFGHEKGAFTGALAQKRGRLELADGGTLFLDEVGDIPLEIQPKLLRVLQDHEFERLGATHTLKVNVRILAATNRDLKRSVDLREFRRDLYYRLNVFPIHVPPLRDRRNDIPLLVRYFVQRFARRMNKQIESISAETMNALVNWDWPGNVRELENFIERSVILTRNSTLAVPVAELRPATESPGKRDTTLMSAEREHILKVLREAGGVISGVRGAAARLGLKRTTLQSKMQKLGIGRQDYQN
jgi:formate hydrogenlyase transcriptional activator